MITSNVRTRSLRLLTILSFTFFIPVLFATAQTVTATHGQFEYLLGVPTFKASTGWIGGNIAGFGAYIEVGGGIGGTLEYISMNGKGMLTQKQDTQWDLSFKGDSGKANMFVGLEAAAQYKLVIPSSISFISGTHSGDITSFGFAFKDEKKFSPYLFNSSVTLETALPEIPTIYKDFYIPGTDKLLSFNVGLTVGTSLTNKISGVSISTSAGELTPATPVKSVSVTSTPYTVNNISEKLKSNVTIYITPQAKVGFTVWAASYQLTIPIYKIPVKVPEQTYQTNTTSMTFNMPAAQLSVSKTGAGNGLLQVNGVSKSFPFGPQTYPYGTSITLKPLPANGSAFNGWTGIIPGGGQKQDPLTFSIGSNKVLTADFTPTTNASESLMIRLSSPFLGGTIKVNGTSYVIGSNTYGGRFKVGEKVSLEYVEGTNDKFYRWTKGTSTYIYENPTIFTIEATQYGEQRVDLAVIRPEYKVSIAKTGNGAGKMFFTINNVIRSTPVPYDTTIGSGVSVKFQPGPNAGNVFTGWDGDLTGTSVTKTVQISKDLNFSVGFHADVRYAVWFQVNMGVYIRLKKFGFNPVTDSVVVRGDFQQYLGSTDWQGNGYLLKKTTNNDSLYYLSIPLPDSVAGRTIQYLFYIIRKGEEFPESNVGNRSYAVTTNPSQTIPTVNFDNQKSSHVVSVTFKADMSNLLSKGFNPENNLVGIRGSNNPLNWNTGALMHRDTVSTQYYSVTATFAGDPGTPVQWKFHTVPDSLFVNSGWETLADNRLFVIPAADTTIGPIAPVIQLVNPLSVHQIQNGTLPADFALGQNYPNPFNPATTITYAIPKSSFVSLKIYDIRGKQVAEIIERYQHAGIYSASFDAAALASGVYMYRLQAGRFSETRKMILIK